MYFETRKGHKQASNLHQCSLILLETIAHKWNEVTPYFLYLQNETKLFTRISKKSTSHR